MLPILCTDVVRIRSSHKVVHHGVVEERESIAHELGGTSKTSRA